MPYQDIIRDFCPQAVLAAFDAGLAILETYNSGFDVEYKADNSPLTTADRASNAIIMERLQTLWSIPVLSEESRQVPYETRREWELFWLVDPLDGTKEFIKRNGEFTVNIALVFEGTPVFGVVYAPVLGSLYVGAVGQGARKAELGIDFHDRDSLAELLHHGGFAKLPSLPFNRPPSENLRVVASRSHLNEATEAFINDLAITTARPVERVPIGSSLKLCLVAEGAADVYPRMAPTMEWDIAAAQAVAEAAGCRVVDANTNASLQYNKQCLTNPFFIVWKPQQA